MRRLKIQIQGLPRSWASESATCNPGPEKAMRTRLVLPEGRTISVLLWLDVKHTLTVKNTLIGAFQAAFEMVPH